ncbi:MAG: hypothetical protein Q8M92_08200 [Candidatus Subteraquimicrobiales bacterium]|nr:hypothetical protein [Candidatus Subteraquimicrobiales bacterium]
MPAPLESYAVYGVSPNGNSDLIGYEFKGAYAPDWQKVLDDKIKKPEENKKDEYEVS